MALSKPIRDLEPVPKTTLKDRQGRSYVQFRATLRPRFGRVLFDLVLGYLFLAGSLWVAIQGSQRFPSLLLPLLLAAAVSTGFWIAYLHLFMHEAAHYNLAPSRRWNDLLSDLLICIWSGQNTASYRIIHWDHHRLLGTTRDTEHSYFNRLDLRFLLEALTGIAAFKVLLFRGQKRKTPKGLRDLLMPATAFLVNGLVLAALAGMGQWPFALAWILGLGVFFPFFGAVRQLLEHRKPGAAADFTRVPHGKFTRLFREGPLGSSLGAAGFTRHLLHHWDPQVSYTRLADMEGFLEGTSWGSRLKTAKTTYLRTFRELFQW